MNLAMKKIGILTIQKSEVNYGASLQTYALWHYLSLLGYECEVIDLLRPCHAQYLNPRQGKIKRAYIRMRHWLTKEPMRKKKFEEFNGLIAYSPCFRSVDELYKNVPKYDVYISGSDQIWNPNMPFDNAPYFLSFAPSGSIKISYASSFGIDDLTNINENVRAKIRYWLNDYAAISVRELSGLKIIHELALQNNEAECVLDPTFLLSRDEWSRLARPVHLNFSNFIFLYTLHYNEEFVKNAMAFADKQNLRVVCVLSSVRRIKSKDSNLIILNNVGPREWLWLIENARIVLTDSFHGTIFSVIYRVPFKVYVDASSLVKGRIISLLSDLELKEHLFFDSAVIPDENVENLNVKKELFILDKKIYGSKTFLKQLDNFA